MSGKTIAIVSLACALALVIGIGIGRPPQTEMEFKMSGDPTVESLRPISHDEAKKIYTREYPSRKLRVFSLFDSWSWRNDPVDAVKGMRGMSGEEGEIGGFEQSIKKRLTVPILIGVAGGILVFGGVLIGWLGKDLPGAMKVGGVGVCLLIAAVAFEAYPGAALAIVLVAAIAGLAYVATSTKAGRSLLEKLGVKQQALDDVVGAIEMVDLAREQAGHAADGSEVKAVKDMVAKKSAANGGTTSAEVKAIVG